MKLFLYFLVELYTLFQLWALSINRKVSWRSAWVFLSAGASAVCGITFVVHLITTRFLDPEINSYALNAGKRNGRWNENWKNQRWRLDKRKTKKLRGKANP